jgi:hypothetical protein
MSGYVKLTGGTDETTGVGAQLVAKAAQFKADAAGVLSDITGKEAGAPWGNDETGQNFLTQYNNVPEGGTQPFSDELKSKLEKAGDDLDKLGTATMQAMVGYQSTDTVNSGDIAAV